MASPWQDVLRIVVALLSALVFALGVVAYRRRPTARMLLVVLLFAAFLVQGGLLAYEVFVADTAVVETAYYAFQAVEIVLIAAIILKR